MQNNHFSHLEEDKIIKSFGKHPNGNAVFCYTLTNSNGVEMNVLNYGATIQSLNIPTSATTKVDVVLGFDSAEDYINSFDLQSAPYFGAIVGRFAGRINEAKLILNNQEIQLTRNHNQHQLHGGNSGFSKAFWEVIALSTSAITLQYISAANEENFPGEVTTQVTYSIINNDEIIVEMTATSNEDTIINLTQHSYFNLDGHSETIENQEVCIDSNAILETTPENIPTGKFISLKNHSFDFSSPKKCPLSIDNTFVIDNSIEAKAQLFSLKNKLKMSVYTNQPAIHVYVGGNCFGKIKGKENTNYHSTSGICFEAQNYPDAPNHTHFPSAVLKKNDSYKCQTIFKFESI